MEYTCGKGLPWWLSGRESACSAEAAGGTVSISESERSPGEGHGTPLQPAFTLDHLQVGGQGANEHC